MATLYVVGTPIGNLEDLTLRARRILSSVAAVACEDTRVTRKLLTHHSLRTAMVSLHQHSTPADIDRLLDRVEGGEDIALVTDAGMPGIADPGGKIVARAVDRGLDIESVPGPSAVTTALSLSGMPADRFLFLGFLPHKKGRETLFNRIAEMKETVVLYESPHRLMKTLPSLQQSIPTRIIAVCRELTKIHESVVRGRPEQVLRHFQEHQDQVRGEIVIIIGPS